MRPLTDGSGVVNGAVGCLSDVTDRAVLHQELEIRVAVDELTSCFNRAATIELVDRTVNAQHDGLGRAVVFVDLDGLKAVNDQLGHSAGDRLLVAAADRIRSALGNGDIVGRLGGDEVLGGVSESRQLCSGNGDGHKDLNCSDDFFDHRRD